MFISRLDKFKTADPRLGSMVTVTTFPRVENVVSAAVGLGSVIVSGTTLKNAVSVVFGLGTAAAIAAVFCWKECSSHI